MVKTFITFIICFTISVIFTGCVNQTEQNTTYLAEADNVQSSSEYLLLQEKNVLDISKLKTAGGITDEKNKLGYCLISFSGKIDSKTLNFSPEYLKIANNDAGFMKEKPVEPDPSINPYPLDSCYSFDKNTSGYTFTLYVKTPISDPEAEQLSKDPRQFLPTIQRRALEILDNTTITVSDENNNSKSYLLTLN